MFCVVGYSRTGIYPVVPGLSISFGCYIVFVVSAGVVASLLGFMARSVSGIASGGVIYMCEFFWD